MMSSSRDELNRDDGPAVAIEDLTVVRGTRTALHDVSVRIARGTITGLLGPSGCGKSTLMRAIVGTQIVASGTVTVLGSPAGSAGLRRRVGYVTQDPTIYDDLRVIDNVRYFASLYGSEAKSADEAIASVGLEDHRTAMCGNLSGGQRTRVSLACALVSHPDLLVLDEPTVGLDPVLRVDLWSSSTSWRAVAPRCWSRATSWMKPTTAPTWCSCEKAGFSLTPHHRNCGRTRDVRHWSRRF